MLSGEDSRVSSCANAICEHASAPAITAAKKNKRFRNMSYSFCSTWWTAGCEAARRSETRRDPGRKSQTLEPEKIRAMTSHSSQLVGLLSQHSTLGLNDPEKNPEKRRSSATSIFIYSCEFVSADHP